MSFCLFFLLLLLLISYTKTKTLVYSNDLVTIALRNHPIPSRTRTWNVGAPMVLQLKLRKSRSSPDLSCTHHFPFTKPHVYSLSLFCSPISLWKGLLFYPFTWIPLISMLSPFILYYPPRLNIFYSFLYVPSSFPFPTICLFSPINIILLFKSYPLLTI